MLSVIKRFLHLHGAAIFLYVMGLLKTLGKYFTGTND